MRYLASVLAMLVVVGIGHAADDEIIARLQKAGVLVWRSSGGINLVCIDSDNADTAIAELCEVRSLNGVEVMRRGLSEPQMRAICNLPRLRYLGIVGTITEADRNSMTHAVSLEALAIAGSVTDEDLKAWTGLQSLQTLDLNGAEITDAGLRVLEKMGGLKTLRLGNCQRVTDEGIAQLRKSRPDLGIVRER